MSLKINEKQNPRAEVTSTQKLPEPITGLSSDDPIGVGSDDTGKPGETNGGSGGTAAGPVARGADTQG